MPPAATTAKTKNRVRIALPSGNGLRRGIFVDGVQVGWCWRVEGIRSDGGGWVVRDLENKSLTRSAATIMDVRDFFDPSPV